MFGAKSAKELAELFVHEFDRMTIRSKTFSAFLSKPRMEGYRSRVRGKLFHLLVRNFEPLQADLRNYATEQVKELNEPLVRGSHYLEYVPVPSQLINAKGVHIPTLVKFGKPMKAASIRIVKQNGHAVEFVDDMYVSCAQGVNGKLWSFLSEIEVKTASAARGFGKQIGFAQLRMGAADVKEIQMIVEGIKDPVRVPPHRIIFSQRSIDRNAITLLSRKTWAGLTDEARLSLTNAIDDGNVAEIYRQSGFRFQTSARGSHHDVFRRITLAIHIDYLDDYVQAIWPKL